MNGLEKLLACAGNWSGNNRLREPNTNLAEDSESTATVTPVLGGRFVRLDYTWGYQGTPQEGSLLIGYDSKADSVAVHWIDTWHMGDKVMVCRGTATDDGDITVHGSYAAPPGPDWGWRIVIRSRGHADLSLTMFNVSPDQREELGVEATYSRV